MARKNIQVCPECRKPIVGEFRMVLRHGVKGFRRYAVHVNCTSAPAGAIGGRQRDAARGKKVGA